jgi:lipid II isoglutaminyl synthase (glutamine-hydrolysing)
MSKPYVTLLGKAVRRIARLRGGGSALPGLFVEKIDPDFIRRTLAQLPDGVVVVSGTNGKTTTTKMIVELLESQGLRVFTNRTGSNFTRGVAAALLGEVDNRGKLDADIAVLELDEGHAVHFVRAVKPRFSLLLNVMRDQLDRFGEIDVTMKLLHKIASATTEGVVVNRDDPRIGSNAFVSTISVPVRSFGASEKLQKVFPSDDDMRRGKQTRSAKLFSDDVSLDDIKDDHATISIDGKEHVLTPQIKGVYNLLNMAGAIAMCRMILGDAFDETKIIETLNKLTPAFGRGETVTVGGQPVELVLVKNPSGFRLSLSSFSPEGYQTMIAVNDNYADGRDMSWLWDVEFKSLRAGGVAEVAGVRAYDMALRLQYDEVQISHVEPDLPTALQHFISNNSTSPKRIYCTYTAMLALRQELGKMTTVEDFS